MIFQLNIWLNVKSFGLIHNHGVVWVYCFILVINEQSKQLTKRENWLQTTQEEFLLQLN